jgi:hypothetical protein
MEMNWEEFAQGPEKNPAEIIHATISTRGTIFLNRRAVEAIGEPDHVILMYDRRRCTIGIKSSPSSRQNAYRLKRKEKRNSGRLIYCANFCRFYHIRPDSTLAFAAPEVDKQGVLILSMHEVRSVKRK